MYSGKVFFRILADKTCKHWHKISAISSFQLKNISFSFQTSASCRWDRERNWRHRWYPAIEKRCVCAHSWKPQLLLAGCPLVPVSSPSSTCLCLGFLSFSLPLQIFSNATEECSNVVEVAELPYPMSRTIVFSFSGYFMKRLHWPSSPPNPTDFMWGFTMCLYVTHTLHTTIVRLHGSININKCHDLFFISD